MKDVIYFARKNQEVKIPSKIDENGGYDIYAHFEEDYLVIEPHETKMIPTGLHSAFSSDYVAILKERGSNGSKGIGQRAGIIDSGFRGEWFVPLTNHNNIPVVISKKPICGITNMIIYPYEKAICQCVMTVVPKLETQEISLEDLLKFESERGTGCLGSSNK